MMRRYELFYELLDYSINRNTGTFKGFLNKVKPIVLSMYDNDADKVAEVFKIAEGMQKFINTGKVNKVIREWVDPNRNRTSWYDAELRREMGL
jgi:DNA-binding sugar fermentation-stimulating protein